MTAEDPNLSEYDPWATYADAGRQRVPDEVWERIKEEFLSGLSATTCARRWGVGLSTIRNRAAKEGWRRADQMYAPPNRLEPDDEGVLLEKQVEGSLDRIDLGDLSNVAERRMMRAVLRGDAVGALRWRRVRDAMKADDAELDRFISQEQMMRDYLAGRGDHPRADDRDSSDVSDGVFSDPAPSAADGYGIARQASSAALSNGASESGT